MAYKGKIINNTKTGQTIKFIKTGYQTDGQLLEMEATFRARSKEPPAHYHPYQEEHFVVMSGELTIRIDGQVRVLKQGDTLHIPSNKVHSIWNNADSKTVVNWKVQPAKEHRPIVGNGNRSCQRRQDK